MSLKLNGAPKMAVLWQKKISKSVDWLVTSENNCYVVWRGFCTDEEPWEESDWRYEAVSMWEYKNEAIESCIPAASGEMNGPRTYRKSKSAEFNGA